MLLPNRAYIRYQSNIYFGLFLVPWSGSHRFKGPKGAKTTAYWTGQNRTAQGGWVPLLVVDFINILKNVSCEYDRWVVETQLCKLHGTSNTLTGRACAMFHDMLCNMVLMNCIYDMVVDTQFHRFHGRPFARVLYVFLMKDIGRWLPWVPPGSTGRFYKGDVVHNHCRCIVRCDCQATDTEC